MSIQLSLSVLAIKEFLMPKPPVLAVVHNINGDINNMLNSVTHRLTKNPNGYTAEQILAEMGPKAQAFVQHFESGHTYLGTAAPALPAVPVVTSASTTAAPASTTPAAPAAAAVITAPATPAASAIPPAQPAAPATPTPVAQPVVQPAVTPAAQPVVQPATSAK
jgi:hypothetical protein